VALKDDLAEAVIGKDGCLRCVQCEKVIIIAHDVLGAPLWWQVWLNDEDTDVPEPLFDCCSEECANEMTNSERFIVPPGDGQHDDPDED